MQSQIESLKQSMLTALEEASNQDAVRELEVQYLGRKGSFNEIMRGLKDLSNEEKGTVGKAANLAKKELEDAQSLLNVVEEQWAEAKENLDKHNQEVSELEILKQEFREAYATYLELKQTQKKVDASDRYLGEPITLEEEANLPLNPFSPNILLIMGVGSTAI